MGIDCDAINSESNVYTKPVIAREIDPQEAFPPKFVCAAFNFSRLPPTAKLLINTNFEPLKEADIETNKLA